MEVSLKERIFVANQVNMIMKYVALGMKVGHLWDLFILKQLNGPG